MVSGVNACYSCKLPPAEWSNWFLRGGTDSEFSFVALRPQRKYGLLGTGREAQDGHLDFHTPPQLCGYQNKSHHRKLEKDILSHAAPAGTRTRDFSVTSPAL